MGGCFGKPSAAKAVNGAAASLDDIYIGCGNAGGGLELRRVEATQSFGPDAGHCAVAAALHTDMINSVTVGSNPTELLSCSEDGTAVLFDWRKQHVLSRWVGHKRGIHDAVFGVHSNCAITAGRDLQICRWSPGRKDAAANYAGHDMSISSLALSPDETLLLSGSRDTTIR